MKTLEKRKKKYSKEVKVKKVTRRTKGVNVPRGKTPSSLTPSENLEEEKRKKKEYESVVSPTVSTQYSTF